MRIRVVKSESADAVELVVGEMLALRSRVDPFPSAGAGEVELHDRARCGARAILVGRIQPILGRTEGVPERTSVNAAELLHLPLYPSTPLQLPLPSLPHLLS